MFSRLKKSFQGSCDNVQPKQTENRTFNDVRDLLDDFEQKSIISTCQSEIVGKAGRRKKERKSRLRNLFRSREEETSSLVSAEPWLHNRSVSLQVLTENNERIPSLNQKEREFNKVEASMQNIQKSLSISTLPQTYLNERSKHPMKLRSEAKNIEKKENSKSKSSVLNNLDKRSKNTLIDQKKPKKSVIDLEIASAELEFEVEKYKLEIMNLKQNMKTPQTVVEDALIKEETLFKKITTSAVLVSEELSRHHLNSVVMRSEGFGLELSNDCGFGHLTVHDRVLELNSLDVFRITKMDWKDLKKNLTFPAKAVFMRQQKDRSREGKTMTDLRSDISRIQSKLEKKLLEGKKTSTELDLVVKERDSLGKENLRLLHRIAFLEDHTKELQLGLKQIQSSLEKTLKTEVSGFLSNLDMMRLPPREGLVSSMSDERSSTATSGIYSNTDSEVSNSPELFDHWAKNRNSETSGERDHGLKNSHLKLPTATNPNQRQVSRIPPPKPVRYHLHHSATNLSKLHSNSNYEISKHSKPSSRISKPKVKSASYLNINRKESHVLV